MSNKSSALGWRWTSLGLIVISSGLALGSVSCKSRNNFSDLRVVNGRPVLASEFPAVVQIGVNLGGGAMAACTSTWVSDRVILTAAHCIEEAINRPGNVSVVDGVGKGLKALKVRIHPSYSANNGNGHDVAILEFPEGSSSSYLPMALVQPKAGDQLVIVGYGKFDHRNGQSGGVKRTGTNKVRGLDYNGRVTFDGLIRPLNGDGTGVDVTNSQGDSGGPMIIDGRVVGVSSSVNSNPTAEGKLRGNYENVRFPAVANWLQGLAAQGVYMIGFSAGTEGLQGTPDNEMSPLNPGSQDENPAEIPDALSTSDLQENATPGYTVPSVPAVAAQLDCNRDYSKIRIGGEGICLNSSSGFCYRYGNRDVLYNLGRVDCR